MARNLQTGCKASRRMGTDLALKRRGGRDISSKCKLNVAPGQHGAKKKARGSDYGFMLRAKQMLKIMYGVLERQFRRYYQKAAHNKGSTGMVLLEILESRLDNVVYRMGFAATRAEARQLVRHKAVLVKGGVEHDDGKVINIPSYQVTPGQVVEIRQAAKQQLRIQDALKIASSLGFPDWVRVNEEHMYGIFERLPERGDLPSEIDEKSVVELYSK
jgi:small subunit ribosomal protein S4